MKRDKCGDDTVLGSRQIVHILQSFCKGGVINTSIFMFSLYVIFILDAQETSVQKTKQMPKKSRPTSSAVSRSEIHMTPGNPK